MSYEKAMKWNKTHRKGVPNLYMGFDTGITIEEPKFSAEQQKESEVESFTRLIGECSDTKFPIYIAESKGFWFITNERNLFGNKIENYEQLIKFYNDYIK